MIAARKNFPKARWVKPVVLVDAEFRGKTGEGLLRHPSFASPLPPIRRMPLAGTAAKRLTALGAFGS
jgi:hypothetical protein